MTQPEGAANEGGSANSVVRHNIRRLRKQLGWTQAELIERSGVTNLKQIETGARLGRRETLHRLANAMGVPLWVLYVDRGDRSVPHELQQFMESPPGKGATPEEYDYLLALPLMLGRKLSYDAYWKALEMLRLSTPIEPAHPPGDDHDTD